jgi:TPR repeat protein
MTLRTILFAAAMILSLIFPQYRAAGQAAGTEIDPLRHGHALLIGNSHYRDPGWPQLDDVALQLDALARGLQGHFDTVEVVKDLESSQLRTKIYDFLKSYGNDSSARLFIYYAGHGYSEVIRQRNENRGYITGIDTPRIDGTSQAYDNARLKAISMAEIRAPLEESLAKSVLVLFDSCFAGTIFTDRYGNDPPRPLIPDVVNRLLEKSARDFITAGRSNQKVPAHSPIPELFLAAINGAADRYQHGVISSAEIHQYLFDQVVRIRDFQLTPQTGRLPNPAFAEGSFLFRVLSSAARPADESETIRRYRTAVAKNDVNAQVGLAYFYSNGSGGVAKDEREAARLYKLAADQGNALAQGSLGLLYEQGRGVAKDEREAARLYKLATDQGSALAQAFLGDLYERGAGVAKDEREAARLYKLAADQGNAYAQNLLGALYKEGRGVAKDEREAARFYKLAVDQGNADAQRSLGFLYEQGRGVAKDEREAARLYKLAADQGNVYAQAFLGDLYERGAGVAKDEREAARLYKLAADQGNESAKAALERLAR